jgi:pilus assembly protein CpaE
LVACAQLACFWGFEEEVMYPLAIGLVIQNSALWADVNATLREFPFRVVADFHAIPHAELPFMQLSDRKPDVIFVEVRDASGESERIISKLKELNVCPTIVALHRAPTVEVVVAALRAGANEFLQSPTPENLRDVLNRAQDRIAAHPHGKAIAVISAKGGCGSTTIGCHSAVAIGKRAAAQGRRALLMDLDLSTGLARFLMKAQSSYSVLDAVSNLQKLDLNYWNALVSATHPGLDVLSAPEEMSAHQQLDRDQVQHMLSFVRTHYDWTILDLGRGLGQLAKSILPEVCEIYLVATHEIAPLHVTKNIFRSLENSGYPLDRVRLIINRVPNIGPALTKEVERVLKVPVFLSLPNDYEALSDCYSYGRLLPKRNKLAAGIETLASAMTGEDPAPKKNLTSRIFGNYGSSALPANQAAV